MLRPACRRCTARLGFAGPIACRLPPHQTVCRRHRLWIGPAARTPVGQLDISQLPEILRTLRCHLAQLRHHPWQHVDIAIRVSGWSWPKTRTKSGRTCSCSGIARSSSPASR